MAARTKPSDGEGPIAGPVTEAITYIPGDGDPSSVKWGGHVFQANVPKELTGHPDGTDREKLNHQIIVAADSNKHFKVGNNRPKRDVAALPKTAEQYRAYMVGWLQDPSIQHTNELIARFAKDRELQASCEVGSDDYSFLATLFMPKLHELAEADEFTEQQVAAIWIQNGINQLPW